MQRCNDNNDDSPGLFTSGYVGKILSTDHGHSTMIPSAVAAAAATATLSGDLFLYARNRVAFESVSPLAIKSSARPPTTHKCILLGGLSDGLWPVPYTQQLAEALPCGGDDIAASSSWSLIQPILSSSYTGFGHSGGLHRDVVELDQLVHYLVTQRHATSIAMVGHSTGCQMIVHYLRHGKYADRVVVAALQAPVSDREAATILHEHHASDMDANARLEQQQQHIAKHQGFVQRARELKDSKQDEEMMPRDAFWAPITAERFLDLMDVGGTDDYFSSDYTDAQLHQRLSHVSHTDTARHVLVAYSGGDEYVPSTIDSAALLVRLCDAMNGRLESASTVSTVANVAIPLYLPTANHNLSSNDGADATVFVQAVCDLLSQVP